MQILLGPQAVEVEETTRGQPRRASCGLSDAEQLEPAPCMPPIGRGSNLMTRPLRVGGGGHRHAVLAWDHRIAQGGVRDKRLTIHAPVTRSKSPATAEHYGVSRVYTDVAGLLADFGSTPSRSCRHRPAFRALPTGPQAGKHVHVNKTLCIRRRGRRADQACRRTRIATRRLSRRDAPPSIAQDARADRGAIGDLSWVFAAAQPSRLPRTRRARASGRAGEARSIRVYFRKPGGDVTSPSLAPPTDKRAGPRAA